MNRVNALAGIALIFVLLKVAHGKEWRGIVPLRSTRQDVIRILGHAEKAGDLYNLSDEVVLIIYSTGTCKEGGVWNVPRDTVETISVSPRRMFPVTHLPFKLSEFAINPDKRLQGILYYNNAEEGIHITTDRGIVRGIDYLPKANERYLRCSKPPFPLMTREGTLVDSHNLFDAYGTLPFEKEMTHLDLFGQRLQGDDQAKGYIVAYPARRMTRRQVLARANRAKGYLVKKYALGRDRIQILSGGSRNELRIELYIMPVKLGTRGQACNLCDSYIHLENPKLD